MGNVGYSKGLSDGVALTLAYGLLSTLSESSSVISYVDGI